MRNADHSEPESWVGDLCSLEDWCACSGFMDKRVNSPGWP